MSQFAHYLRTLREKGPETDDSDPEESQADSGKTQPMAPSEPPPQAPPPLQSPPRQTAPAGTEVFVNVALRDGQILILGLADEPLPVSGRTAERLARRLLDAVALARGQHPGQSSGS